MDLPSNASTGTVHGRYIAKLIDGMDPNQEPDALAVSGSIVFTASVPYLQDPTALPDPVTIMTVPIVGILDGEGYLCTPYADTGEPMYRGVKLAATDDPDLSVQNWTWDVTYVFNSINGHRIAIPAHGFTLPSGEDVDLTKVAKVPSSPGYSLPQAEAAVLRAEAIAQSIRDDANAGLFNGAAATLEIGDVTSGATANVVNVGDEQHAVLNITLEKGDTGDTGAGVPSGGAPLQVVRKTLDGETTEWADADKNFVGLSNVDNTADIDKPVSGPTELALAEKADAEEVNLAVSAKADRMFVEPVINFSEFGGIADGVIDNAALMDAALAEARATKRTLFIPAGRWLISGTHDWSGCNVAGELSGYYNQNGTVLVGDGTSDMFVQQQVNLANITMSMTRLRIENAGRGIIMSYSIYSTLDDIYVGAVGDAITLGVNTLIGPIWNVFSRVKSDSSTASGLVLGGKDWCNSNLFDTCDFKGKRSAIRVESSGGYGALDNIFHNTEVRGDAIGFEFLGQSKATTISSCYLEPKGPAIVVAASTLDLQLSGNVYGTSGNDVGLASRFIDHRSGTLDLKIDGGWVTTNAGGRQDNMDFIGSDVPASASFAFVSEPALSTSSAGFKLFNTATLSAKTLRQRGDFVVSKHGTPRVTIEYPDGSRPFSIRRNGSQGGADFGVYFRNDGIDAVTIDSVGNFNVLQNLGSAKTVAATTPGSVIRRLPIYDASGVLLGQIPIYNNIT